MGLGTSHIGLHATLLSQQLSAIQFHWGMKEEDLVHKQPSSPVMGDGWPRNAANGQTIPRVIDIEARDAADRAEKIYGRDAIGFPTKTRVADGYRRELSTDPPELITAWVNTLPNDFLGDCLEF